MSDKKQIESKAVPSKAADADNPNPNDENDNLDQVVEATDILKSVQLTDDAPAEPVEEEDPDEEEIEAKIPENLKEALETLKNDDSIQGFFGHNDSVFCVALSPTDEKLALSGDGADKAYLWDITSGDTLFEVDGHKDSVCSCGFSFDGKYFATASMDGTVKVFNTSDRSLAHVLDGPSAEIEFMAWHPKGHVIAAGSADNTCWVWNAANGQCMHALSGHQGPVMCGTWTEDGKTLCTGSEDGIFVWNMKTGKPRHHIKGHGAHEGPVTCLAAHHDPAQPLLLSASQDGSAKIFHLDTGKVLQTLRGHSDSVETVAFCRVMPWCATGGVDGQVIVFDVRNGQTRVKFNHEDAVTHLEWHPKEPLLFTASVDKTVRLWDARSGAQVQTWKGHTDAILEFALSKDGTTIVTASDDRTALVFSTAPQPPGPVFAVSAAAPPPAK